MLATTTVRGGAIWVSRHLHCLVMHHLGQDGIMTKLQRTGRIAATTLALAFMGACSNAGGLGNVLGGVLGTPESTNQLSGTVRRVDTQNQQIMLQQANGQTLTVAYDNKTQVTYQNQNYPVTSLDPGDQVTARIQSGNNGGYYTDLVQVTQPVNGSATGSSSCPPGSPAPTRNAARRRWYSARRRCSRRMARATAPRRGPAAA